MPFSKAVLSYSCMDEIDSVLIQRHITALSTSTEPLSKLQDYADEILKLLDAAKRSVIRFVQDSADKQIRTRRKSIADENDLDDFKEWRLCLASNMKENMRTSLRNMQRCRQALVNRIVKTEEEWEKAGEKPQKGMARGLEVYFGSIKTHNAKSITDNPDDEDYEDSSSGDDVGVLYEDPEEIVYSDEVDF